MHKRKTGYVVKVYPRFSETFIVTEILAREAAGDELEIFALRPTTDTRFHPEIARVQAPVHFVSRPLKLSTAWEVHSRAVATIDGFAERFAQLAKELAQYDASDVHQAIDLACQVTERGITHLHAHFGSLSGQTAEIAALLAGIEFSVTTHAKDLFHHTVNPVRLERTLARAHHTVTISDYNYKHLVNHFPGATRRLYRIYNGLELQRFPYHAPAELSSTRSLRILGVGRLVAKKGFADLFSAVAQLIRSGSAVEVRIAGDGELRDDLHQCIQKLNLDSVVTMLGAQTQEEVRGLLEWADVFVAPCVVGEDGNADGLPTVLLEAMASGVPCIGSTVTGIPEAIEHGVSGLLHEPGNIVELAACLQQVADPTFPRHEIARNARARIETQFDSAVQARVLMDLEDTQLLGKKVAYVSVDPGVPVFGRKGASVHVQEVIRELVKRGAQVTIFTTRVGEETPEDLSAVKVVCSHIDTKDTVERENAQARISQEFSSAIAQGGFDFVYERYSLFSTTIALLAPAGIPGILEVNAPLITEQATHRELAQPGKAYAALNVQAHSAARIVAVSEPVAAWVRENTGVTTVNVVPNGVNTDRIVPGLASGEEPGGKAKVVFVGTLKPWHGADVLIDAVAASAGDWSLRIVGDGPVGQELRQRVADLGLAHRVEFTGAIAPADIPAYLADCDAAVAPYPEVAAQDSYFSPLKVYEYLAAGLPVVASEIGQLPSILGPSAAGILVPPSNAKVLAQELDALMADPLRRTKMSRAARAQAVESHSWAHAVDAIVHGVRLSPMCVIDQLNGKPHSEVYSEL